MILEPLDDDERGARALITWEQAEREPIDLRIESDTPGVIRGGPDTFLPAVAVAAQTFGEERVICGTPASPLLLDGLPTALAWLRHNSASERAPLRIEIEPDPEPAALRPTRHGMFFSGGVDSMAALFHNVERVPVGHPHRIRDLVYINGFEEESSGGAADAVRAVGEATGTEVIEVRTNLAALDTHDRLHWEDRLHGAVLGSLANALAPRLGRVTIAPSLWIGPSRHLRQPALHRRQLLQRCGADPSSPLRGEPNRAPGVDRPLVGGSSLAAPVFAEHRRRTQLWTV